MAADNLWICAECNELYTEKKQGCMMCDGRLEHFVKVEEIYDDESEEDEEFES